MKKKLLSAIAATIISLSGLSAEAVLLPHNMQVYLFTNVSGATIRFDGLINLPDGTMYIPVIPAAPKDVDRLEVVYTYPDNLSVASRPDVIVFNNNYSLLKVLYDGKKRTVTNYDNLPEVILTGIFPQDMLVPTGFYISENLRGLLGNLEIPVNVKAIEKEPVKKNTTKIVIAKKEEIKENKNTATNKTTGKKVVKTVKKTVKTVIPKEIENKMFLVTNFDSQYLKVFSPGRPEPIYGLKLKGVLKDLKVTPDKNYLLTAVFGKNEVDVADITNEQIAKSLDIEAQPSEITVDNDANKAYIMTAEGQAIYVVDLAEMIITEKIKLNAVPYRMTLSPDGSQLAYGDKNTDMIYILKIDDEYKNIPVTKMPNISKIVIDDANRLYTVSRTSNTLLVSDYSLSKPFVTGEETDDKGVQLQKKFARNTRRILGVGLAIPQDAESGDTEELEDNTATVEEHKIKTGAKPTEMYLYGKKLFVLCSGENTIYVMDTETLKFIDKITMPFNGFPRMITGIENSELAIVTDANAKKYSVINLKTNKIVGTYAIDMPVHSITIINKINNINLIEQSL